MTITTRAAKGAPLTNAELDANFTDLRDLKAPLASPSFTGGAVFSSGSTTIPGVRVVGAGPSQGAIYFGSTDNLYRVSSGDDYVGTMFDIPTAKDYIFYTGSVARLAIKGSGNVLINTTTDNGTDKLQVAGSAKLTGNLSAVNAAASVNITADGIASGTNGGSAVNARVGGVTSVAIGNKSAILGGAYDATPFLYANSAISTNFGFNITAPAVSGGVMSWRAGSDGVRGIGYLYSDGGGAGVADMSNGIGNGVYWSTANSYVTLQTAGNECMRGTASGNVLIGRTVSYAFARLAVDAVNAASAVGAGGWVAADFGGAGATGNRVVMGSYLNRALLGAHNHNLTAWAPLYINEGGSNVILGNTPDDGVNKLQVVGTVKATAVVVGGGTTTSNTELLSHVDGNGTTPVKIAAFGIGGTNSVAFGGQMRWYTSTGNGGSLYKEGFALSLRAYDESGPGYETTDIVRFSPTGTTIQSTNQAEGQMNLIVTNSAQFLVGAGAYGNVAACVLRINSAQGRSLNAGGSINAVGNDYAEYMLKNATCGIVTKGQVVGIDASGELTDKWAEAVSFMVKTTNPSYVGGDTWGTDLEGEALESARAKVDRIAFAGQVPVNVYGAHPGQFIVPVQVGVGISGIAVNEADLTLKQYIKSVGIVQNILTDGRANVRVKVA